EPDKAFGSWNGNPHPYDQLAIDRTREVNGLGYAAIRSVAGNQDRMIFLHPNAMSSIGTAKALYPSKWSLPGGGKDACVGVTVHTYDPYDFCGENGHSNYYANPSAMKKDLIFKFKDLRDWAFETCSVQAICPAIEYAIEMKTQTETPSTAPERSLPPQSTQNHAHRRLPITVCYAGLAQRSLAGDCRM
ncbi:unnamed protein product, partial [Symbiodinium microadriaticum]